MKTATLAGLALLVLGVLSLAYQGIAYTTHKKVVDIGPIQATKEEKQTIPLSPILGGIALVGGVVLLMAGPWHEGKSEGRGLCFAMHWALSSWR
ncbi:MAG TPA: hypothetical protein VIW93_02350 [Candidatus Acidoferrum sp.]